MSLSGLLWFKQPDSFNDLKTYLAMKSHVPAPQLSVYSRMVCICNNAHVTCSAACPKCGKMMNPIFDATEISAYFQYGRCLECASGMLCYKKPPAFRSSDFRRATRRNIDHVAIFGEEVTSEADSLVPPGQ